MTHTHFIVKFHRRMILSGDAVLVVTLGSVCWGKASSSEILFSLRLECLGRPFDLLRRAFDRAGSPDSDYRQSTECSSDSENY
jgi:hypothetical protein